MKAVGTRDGMFRSKPSSAIGSCLTSESNQSARVHVCDIDRGKAQSGRRGVPVGERRMAFTSAAGASSAMVANWS